MSGGVNFTEEKRLFERIPCDLEVKGRRKLWRSSVPALSYDFSAGGLGLLVEKKFNVGEEVSIKVNFYHKFEPLSAKAKVIWVNQRRTGKWRIGLNITPYELLKFLPFPVGK